MAISNLVTSAHAVCYINSIPFARCCGLTLNISSPRREIKGIDVLEPVELVPTDLTTFGTIQIYRLHQDGGIEAAGLVATWQNLTKEKYASMMVLDRSTDTVLVQVDKFCVTNQSWTINPKAYVLGTVAFTGFGYSNDAQ